MHWYRCVHVSCMFCAYLVVVPLITGVAWVRNSRALWKMSTQTFPCDADGAFVTLDFVVFRVSLFVILQIAHFIKLFSTNPAAVRLFASMGQFVGQQLPSSCEPLTAFVAGIGNSRAFDFMLVPSLPCGKGNLALIASKNRPVCCMDFLVVHE